MKGRFWAENDQSRRRHYNNRFAKTLDSGVGVPVDANRELLADCHQATVALLLSNLNTFSHDHPLLRLITKPFIKFDNREV